MFLNAQHPRNEQVRLSDSKVLVFSKLGKIHARLQAYFVHFVSISIQFCIIPVKKTVENCGKQSKMQSIIRSSLTAGHFTVVYFSS